MVDYPAKIDTTVTLPSVVDNSTPVEGKVVNRLRDAILAIENELGVRPSAIYTTVRSRLDNLEGIIGNLSIIELNQDLGGTLENPIVIGIQGKPISTIAPALGDALVWNGIAWEPAPVVVGGTGLVGPQGSPGVTGMPGSQGSPGPTGIAGLMGPQGSPGVTGMQGVTGSQGVTGPQGATGAQGITGVQGVTGMQGVTGSQGVTGPQGATGATGPDGSQANFVYFLTGTATLIPNSINVLISTNVATGILPTASTWIGKSIVVKKININSDRPIVAAGTDTIDTVATAYQIAGAFGSSTFVSLGATGVISFPGTS